MGKPAASLGSALLGLATLAGADDGPPAQLRTAQYVFVRPFRVDALDPDARDDDRRAVADVERALKDWGRFRLATRETQADLVLVVRTGSRGSANVGGRRPGDRVGRSLSFGAETGTAEDYLAVFEGRRLNWDDASPLWKRNSPGGFKAPALVLFGAFREAVEGGP